MHLFKNCYFKLYKAENQSKFSYLWGFFHGVPTGGFQCDVGSEELSPKRSRDEDYKDQTRWPS